MPPVTPAPAARVRYRDVFGQREFATLFAAGGLSVAGDQLARIAVALLVFERSGSALAASATYACSYLAWLLGGPVLSALSDRHSWRRLMISVDLLRMLLVVLLVLPGLPLWLLFVVLSAIGLLSPPFEAARSALLADVLDGDAYVAGNALTQTANQAAQVVGFVAGGALVALISTEGALLANAATFAVSALLLSLGVRERGRPSTGPPAPLLREAAEGARLVARTPLLRSLLIWALLDTAIVIAPEGLAVAIADDTGGGALAAGILTASVPAGFLLGSFLLVRVRPERRQALFLPLVLLSGLPLLATPFLHSTALLAACWVLAGTGTALQLIANAAFVQAVPRHLRGRAYGVAGTALAAVQGVVLLLAGALAEVTGPEAAVALIALLGLALVPVARRAGRTKVQGSASTCRVAS